jgi:hypothetical protein
MDKKGKRTYLRWADQVRFRTTIYLMLSEPAAISPAGGILTSRWFGPVQQINHASLKTRIRHEIKLDLLPEFHGCPDWIKPIMYREYQVSFCTKHNLSFRN